MVDIGTYGWKIKNFKAATIVGKNMGIRDKYDFTNAVWHHSLFSNWLRTHGLKTGKTDESTRDIICIDFQFGLRSYEEELKHLKQMRKEAEKEEDETAKAERLKLLDDLDKRVESKKDLYKKMSKEEIREYLYVNGADITYSHIDKKTGEEVIEETIHYKMLYRSPSKAKQGSSIWIREELYDAAYHWITMGIGERLPEKNADIVAISAYAPLSTSSIENTFQLDIDSVLIVKDQESFFHTIADIVRAEDYETYEQQQVEGKKKKVPVLVTKKKCVVHREETDVKSVIWDGEALIESDALPEGYEDAGMALLRQSFFKACAFKTRIQLFFKDYCEEHGLDYDTFEVTDYFGKKHLAKNIKMIITEDATKFKRFAQYLGGDFESAYEYWTKWVKENDCVWGIVKRDHKSKLGNQQRMSYQALNSLPVTEEEMAKITSGSVKYVESLKTDNNVFVEYLRKNANIVNSYEMLADLYEWNSNIGNTKFFRYHKKKIISNYVNTLKNGKITANGDNLTCVGNPYALLLYVVGEDWSKDPTLVAVDGAIQCYTKRFEDGEYLCGIRSPHNSSNNLAYYQNVRHPLMEKYFDFSRNIIAVNCIGTDVQSRMNGMDFDFLA